MHAMHVQLHAMQMQRMSTRVAETKTCVVFILPAKCWLLFSRVFEAVAARLLCHD